MILLLYVWYTLEVGSVLDDDSKTVHLEHEGGIALYRLFIVDDNKYERHGLRKSIDWEAIGVEVVGVFENGAEAMARIDELDPHIIITDIAMPVMNGIEMSEQIAKRYPEIKVIFISCHSDFEFAKSAVDLGIHGYVLKPVIADELVDAVKKLVQELEAHHSQRVEKERMMQQMKAMLPLVQEQFFKELLLGNFHDEADIRRRMDFLEIMVRPNVCIHTLSIHLSDLPERPGNEAVADAYFVSYAVKSIVTSLNSETRSLYPVQISETEYTAIVFDADRHGSVMNVAVEMSEEIGRRLELTATIGISNPSQELVDLSVLYKQSQKAVHTRFYSGSNPIITYEEIEDLSDGPFADMPNLETVYQDIKTLLSYGGEQEVAEFVNKYLDTRESRAEGRYVKGFAFLAVNVARIILMEAHPSLHDIADEDRSGWRWFNQPETLTEVKQGLTDWFMAILERLNDKNTTKHHKVVDQIKEIIHRRYPEKISIEDISKAVYLSGRHANALFKKETGKTIFDYVIEVRIEKAKLLLRETDSKVAVVAEEVGYLNTSYFCLAFKKNVGMTPAEYKSKVVL